MTRVGTVLEAMVRRIRVRFFFFFSGQEVELRML